MMSMRRGGTGAAGVARPVVIRRRSLLSDEPGLHAAIMNHDQWRAKGPCPVGVPQRILLASVRYSTMTLTMGSVRRHHVVEFHEGRRIAWKPAERRAEPARASVAMGARAAATRRAHWLSQ